MDATLGDRLREEVSASRLQRHLEWFSQVRRDTGGDGEARAAAYIAEQAASGGAAVRVHEFDAYLSYPREARLTLAGPQSVTEIGALTHAFCASTPPGGTTATAVAVDLDSVAAARGQIALFDGLCSPNKILAAQEAGAVGVVFSCSDWFVHNMIGTTIWGTPQLDQSERLLRIPAVSINHEDGERLRAARDAEVRLDARVETGWYRSQLPEVRIAGRDEPEDFVLIGAHYCAWHAGVTDNATGDATLLELARILHEQRDALRRSVRICWWPGHSHGRYSGSTWYADTFYQDLADHCLAYHNIDSPGVRGATLYVARHTSAELASFVERAVLPRVAQSELPVHRPAKSADQSFLGIGIPSYSCYPFLPPDHPDHRPWTGGCGNAWWWHTEYDTLDKADVEILTADVGLSLVTVSELANAEVLPYDYGLLAAELRGWLGRYAGVVGDDVDLRGALQAGERLVAACTKLRAARERQAQADTRAFNRALLEIGRTLNPVVYAKHDRFTHDPADRVPVMKDQGNQVICPGLQPGWMLPTLRGDVQYGFLRAQTVRARNRLTHAMTEATRRIEQILQA